VIKQDRPLLVQGDFVELREYRLESYKNDHYKETIKFILDHMEKLKLEKGKKEDTVMYLVNGTSVENISNTKTLCVEIFIGDVPTIIPAFLISGIFRKNTDENLKQSKDYFRSFVFVSILSYNNFINRNWKKYRITSSWGAFLLPPYVKSKVA